MNADTPTDHSRFETIADSPVGVRILDDIASSETDSTATIAQLTEARLYEIVAHAAQEVSSEKWSSPPHRLFPWEERIAPEQAARLARAVPACAAARWWSGTATSRPQVWLGRVAAAPAGGVSAQPAGGKPATELWTSSALAGAPSAWWAVLTGGRVAVHATTWSIWRIDPPPSAHVYEIRVPDDWRRLCETFPGKVVDGFVQPDWDAAREQFDGIHLTVEGLVRVQGVQIETERGPAMLDDWDAESTAWLRWSVASLERLGTATDPRNQYVEPRRRLFRRGDRRR